MPFRVQFVDEIESVPTVRLDLNNDSPWRVIAEGTDLTPPRLRRAVASSMMAEGAIVQAAAYENRVITLTLHMWKNTTAEQAADALQDLARELDRPGGNLLLWQPDTDNPVFFRTFRSDFSNVDWEPVAKRATVSILAEPFAYGLKQELTTTEIANDPVALTAVPTVSDTFTRTASSGWGSADSGQAWTTTGGSATDYNVSGGLGTHLLGTATTSRYSYMASGASFKDGDLLVSFKGSAASITGDAVLTGILARGSNTSSAGTQVWYHAQAALNTAGTMTAWLNRNAAGVETTITSSVVSGITYSSSATYRMRFRLRGPHLKVRIWDTANEEPLTWTINTTDTNITTAGEIGIRSRRLTANTNANFTFSLDNFQAEQNFGPGYFDVTNVKGDVETPLFLKFDALWLSAAGVSGRNQSVIAVRRRGTPSNFTHVLQAETGSVGTATTLQANNVLYSGSGQNFTRTTFSDGTSANVRLQFGTFPASPFVDNRGTYRAFARVKKSAASDTMTMRLDIYQDSENIITGDTVTLPASDDFRFVDLGLYQFPTGTDPVDDGYSRTEQTVSGTSFDVRAARTSGAGTLDIDYIAFLPADDRLMLARWPRFSGPKYIIVDSARSLAYGQGIVATTTDTGIRSAVVIDIIGGTPLVTPGSQVNRVYFIHDVGTESDQGDILSTEIKVTPYYWPRYLYVRPAAS